MGRAYGVLLFCVAWISSLLVRPDLGRIAPFPFSGCCGFGFRDAASGLLAYLCGFSLRPFAGLALGRSGGGPAVPAFRLRGRSRPARVGFLVRSGSSCSVVCRLRFCLVLLLRSLSRFPRRRSLSRPVSAGRSRVRPCSRPLSFVALLLCRRVVLGRLVRPAPSRLPFALPPAVARGLACRLVSSSSALSAGAGLPVAAARPALSPRPRPLPARSRSLPGLIWLGHSPGFSSDWRPAFGLSAVRAFCRWGTARC